ncbi:hypothetical protein [Lacipirellula limnantheis]|uniref:Uncharacterized protein n=1 Tax=Lacipirellula limnantheis TaxID=2528024 RepID=A0A517U568_9BACT|nr:hypothetical protein [Lacipirellula limnantheis]QDT75753.1 hypothetical protein I41_49950 [Lacipirellula limnantheis]
MGTTVKARPTAQRHGATLLQEELDRENDRRALMLAAFERRKDQLIAEVPDLERAPLYLTSKDVAVFEEFGLKRADEIATALQIHAGIAEARALVGDPAVIEAARAELAAAVRNEQTLRAEAEDLDGDAEDEPALAMQIKSLQRRLGQLTAARVDAENKVRRFESRRDWLRTQAPPAMRLDITKEITRRQLIDPVWQRLREVELQIHGFEKLLEIARDSRSDDNPVFCNHARVHCADAFRSNYGSPRVDLGLFSKHLDQLRGELLPALKAEQADLQAKWQATVAEIEAGLDHWIATGEVLRA